jgi:hypothetical protein
MGNSPGHWAHILGHPPSILSLVLFYSLRRLGTSPAGFTEAAAGNVEPYFFSFLMLFNVSLFGAFFYSASWLGVSLLTP